MRDKVTYYFIFSLIMILFLGCSSYNKIKKSENYKPKLLKSEQQVTINNRQNRTEINDIVFKLEENDSNGLIVIIKVLKTNIYEYDKTTVLKNLYRVGAPEKVKTGLGDVLAETLILPAVPFMLALGDNPYDAGARTKKITKYENKSTNHIVEKDDVTDPAKNISVRVEDSLGNIETILTDDSGKAVLNYETLLFLNNGVDLNLKVSIDETHKDKKIHVLKIIDRIDSIPPNATIYTGTEENTLSETEYKTPFNNITYTINPVIESKYVQIKLENYSPSKIIHFPPDKLLREATIALNLCPKKTIIQKLISTPKGANIYWGTNERSLIDSGKTTPFIEKKIECDPKFDNLYVQLKKKGYDDSEVKYFPSSSSSRNMVFKLSECIQSTITQKILSTPSKAIVYFGTDRNLLKCSGKATPLSENIRDCNPEFQDLYVQVKKNGYADSEILFLPSSKTNRQLEFTLRKIKTGLIKYTANESGVDVWINDELFGKIMGKPFVKKVPIGTYKVMIKKQFFSPVTFKETVGEDDIKDREFNLVKVTGFSTGTKQGDIKQGWGSLKILTVHDDFTLIIEGAKETAPLEIPRIAAGVYDIKILGPGINKTIKQTIEDGGSHRIDLDEMFNR